MGESVRRRYGLEHQSSDGAQTSYHQAILSTMTLVPVEMEVEKSDTRSSRPVSPVKLLSNIFGGNGGKDAIARSNNPTTLTPHSRDLPPMPPPIGQLPQANSARSIHDIEGRGKVTLVAPSIASGSEKVIDRLALLEDTFTAYIVALRSRSGNVVGRVLRGRAGADELAVNELYNILSKIGTSVFWFRNINVCVVENPSEIKAAAEVSVDVLFVAFEKFLRSAWRERMGPVLAPNILKSMQTRFGRSKTLFHLERLRKIPRKSAMRLERSAAGVESIVSHLESHLARRWTRRHLQRNLCHLLLTISHLLIYVLDLVRPDEAGEHFRSLLEEMTPQNRRAFATMIKLLSTYVSP